MNTSKRRLMHSSQVRPNTEAPYWSKNVLMTVAGKFKGVEKMVTSRIYIDDIATKGFDELVMNKDKHIKILVTTHEDKV